jgi:hypothetical protein
VSVRRVSAIMLGILVAVAAIGVTAPAALAATSGLLVRRRRRRRRALALAAMAPVTPGES